jgi:hypothetical protein
MLKEVIIVVTCTFFYQIISKLWLGLLCFLSKVLVMHTTPETKPDFFLDVSFRIVLGVKGSTCMYYSSKSFCFLGDKWS